MAGAKHNIAGAMSTASVYPLVPTRSFDDPLTYRVPDELAGVVVAGSIVEIPVGPAARVGVVAATGVEAPEGVALRDVRRVLDPVGVPAPLVLLAEWLADQFGCARTRALALVVPPRLAAHARATAVPQRRRVQAVRSVRGVPDAPGAGGPAVSDGLSVREAADPASRESPTALGARVQAVAEQLPPAWTPVSEVVERLRTTRPTLRKLAAAGVAELEQRWIDELGQAEATAGASRGAGVAAWSPPQPGNVGNGRPVLTAAQMLAVDTCAAAPRDEPGSVLLGITGSGKTEVYLELIERALAAGRGAIVLVPEIALTPQTSRRFVSRFPGTVEVLHSELTRVQRSDAYDRIAAGGARVVVGARSALFAPVRELGVIVVDEEHDGSYKQESEPRYDARRVAWKRAVLEGAIVVYGSATPRPETWHGVRRRVLLRERPGGARLAPVELVDLRVQGDGFPITEPVQAALDATLRRGAKAMVLQNRRGYAGALHCRTCGSSMQCPSCDVALVIHGVRAAAQQLACHHCGYTVATPQQCAVCGAADIARVGAGTERLERDLVEVFGGRVVRLDADAARGRGTVARLLDEFAAPGPAVLVGTQMIAKGHDFPDVELAVVIDADTALAIPDFRATERAFNLVAQLAGRAGRSRESAAHARVLVQTWDVEQPFLAHALQHDVEGFLADELARRCARRYPPFVRLVRVLVSAHEARAADRWAHAVVDGVRRLEAGPVLGPAELLRIADRQRRQVLVKTTSVPAVAAAVRRFLRTTEAERRRTDVRVLLDVDPQSLL